jgi:outer membrane receptor protein involved in Fe transport
MSCAIAAILSGYGSTVAFADTAAAPVDNGGIEQIVVSATRRNESVQNVPSTIQAFTGSNLAELNVTNLDALLKYTPNVTYGNNGPGQGDIIMRGLSNGFRGGQSSSTIGNFPNVAIYLDDQAMTFPARNDDIYMVDMNRVEVLEGPQGTLFGGGAEAGAIRYITNKPNLDAFEGHVEGMYGLTSGGDNNSSVNGMLNVPIIDGKLAVRVVVYDEKQGGYIDNVLSNFTRNNDDLGNHYFGITPTGGLCPNGKPTTSGFCALPVAQAPTINNASTAEKNFNPVEYSGARAEIAYKFNNDWDVLITQSFDNLDSSGMFADYPVGSDFQKLKPLQVTTFTPTYDKDHAENTSWTVNGQIGDIKAVYTGGYMVRNINSQMDYANYSRTTVGAYYQCVGGTTPWGPAGAPDQCFSPAGYWHDTVRNTHISHELRFSTPDDWRFRVIAGAYYEDYKIYDDMDFSYRPTPGVPDCDPANLAAALAGGPTCVADVKPEPGTTANHPGLRASPVSFGEDTQRGYKQTAGFVSMDYDIIPGLTVKAGTRWYQYQEFEVGSVYSATLPCMNVPNGECGAGSYTNINAENERKTYVGFKSSAGVQYHIDDNIMVYYTWSQGFRPGGFNRAGGPVAPDASGVKQYNRPTAYAPDSLINNEIGMKGQFFDNRLQLNLSAYYMRWNDVQFVFFNPLYIGNTTFSVNGPDYDVKGGEFQFTAALTDQLTLQGSGSYNDNTQQTSPCLAGNIPGTAAFGKCITEIVPKGSVTGAAVPFINPFGDPGSTAPFSPKFQGNARVRYDWTMDTFAAFAMFGVNYMGSTFNQPASYEQGAGVEIPTTTFLRYKQPAYTTLDLTLGISRDKWTAQLFGNNLTNSHASTFTSSAQFIKSEVPLRPRVIGVKVGYTF